MATDSYGFENYTVDEIRAAFAKHATKDDWGVESFYEDGLIAALRGEYDTPEPEFEEYVTVDMTRGVAITHHENGSTTERPLHPAFTDWMNHA